MMHSFLFPDGIMYLVVKFTVLFLVLMLWLASISSPAV